MSATLPFRARPGVLTLGTDDAAAMTVRVQFADRWDTISVRCGGAVSVETLVQAAIDAFGQHQHPAHEFVLKLHGHEVRDLGATLSATGAREGSTFLLAFRHRRPVR